MNESNTPARINMAFLELNENNPEMKIYKGWPYTWLWNNGIEIPPLQYGVIKYNFPILFLMCIFYIFPLLFILHGLDAAIAITTSLLYSLVISLITTFALYVRAKLKAIKPWDNLR